MQPILYLLKPGFYDGPGDPYYCPYCMIFEGVLKTYPQLKDRLKVCYVSFEKPRKEIIDLIGEENQSCPVIIFDHPLDPSIPFQAKKYGDKFFLNEPEEIGLYLSKEFKIPRPHF
ncbi:DUF3088 domain-containing protein [Candidatus Methylacidiphilum fumarolicum]|uniref:DUF3088 domain-containing protein n=2 Tax=Candidatus Methylacidiphilum fumarolicum TaxID=591154 RepID=I0K1L1_METFB|nr:DUF3088 family protein [Candidatus Methylacidiphilum fumarolicum]MBW6415470.1 DUF3088 domain-containing protein [Candidatus Methylacidiphilum fumarolicum]TFE68527.1 hypothetical protein A7K73_07510 [Candidatus Methylacidiphilum fumarolicum]TFE73245.1 DUF3088 domain-containing protein [Candidatus Methylacidiphilum fumarolicum]TFE73272.1 DUF3088 domain-containing protein [Candidatus Methylacidiphilum fumarolicum]TFE76471.1 hypothetical protein A7D33_09730 [Candidatus Methylacidiphilum fumarol